MDNNGFPLKEVPGHASLAIIKEHTDIRRLIAGINIKISAGDGGKDREFSNMQLVVVPDLGKPI
jgi:hypothetical protein